MCPQGWTMSKQWKIAAALAVVLLGGWLLLRWAPWQAQGPGPGFVSGNGRIEATEIAVAAKLAGRVLDVLAAEGDFVKAGQPLARMQIDSLQAQREEAVARLQQAQLAISSAQVQVAQREGFFSSQLLDDDRAKVRSQQAAVTAAQAQAKAAQAGIGASRTQVTSAEANVRALQATLARIDVQLVDLSDVYMTFFLPETVAGRVALGSEVRIVLDAAPGFVIPATVSFVASTAQFTPKTVETASERQKLMFRVRAQIDKALLLRHQEQVKTGLPGVAWLRVDPAVEWPANLAVKADQ